MKYLSFFGLKKSALFRLTETEYSKLLPKLIVIHCNTQPAHNDDEPVIIEDNYLSLITTLKHGLAVQIMKLMKQQCCHL